MNRKNSVVCVCLSIMTLGFYGIYWFIKLTEEVYRLAEPEKEAGGWKAFLLNAVTFGLYGYYWAWKMGGLVSDIGKKRGIKASRPPAVYVIWEFFCPPVVWMLLQNEVNRLEEMESDIPAREPVQAERGKTFIAAGFLCAAGAFVMLPAFLIVRAAFMVPPSELTVRIMMELNVNFNGLLGPVFFVGGAAALLAGGIGLTYRKDGMAQKKYGAVLFSGMTVFAAGMFIQAVYFRQFYDIPVFAGGFLRQGSNLLMAAGALAACVFGVLLSGNDYEAYRRSKRKAALASAAAAVMFALMFVVCLIETLRLFSGNFVCYASGSTALGLPFLLLAAGRLAAASPPVSRESAG